MMYCICNGKGKYTRTVPCNRCWIFNINRSLFSVNRVNNNLRFFIEIKFDFEKVSYIVVPEKLNFNDAENNCKELGGHLATVTSTNANGELAKRLRDK